MADSISKVYEKYNTSEMKDFLDRKAHILEFDALALIDRSGACTALSVEDNAVLNLQKIVSLPQEQNLFEDTVNVGFFDQQMLFYSAPVYSKGEISHVLVGVRTKEKMQSMISSKAFLGRTASCIVDKEGLVLLSPVDLESFLYLDEVFGIDTKKVYLSEVVKIQKDMDSGTNGKIQFIDENGNENILAYNFLGISDWILLTIVPVNLISGSASTYNLRSILIIAGISLVFLLFLMVIYKMNTENRKRLTELAFTDSITGGMNGTAFQRRYESCTQKHKVFSCVVVILNIRNFKLFNEKFGFSTGNQILRYIYQVIDTQLNKEEDEFAARSEMDHFFICMQESNPRKIQKRIDGITQRINTFHNLESPKYQIRFAAGCCLVQDSTLDINVIQDRARIAARSEQENGRDACIFYDEDVAERVRQERELDEMFEKAIACHEFQVYLQPKVNLKTNRPEGAEALVRWQHPERGLIAPNVFIPVFERNGKICKLDLYVFEEVCKFYKRRQREGKVWYPVSVNLSRYHFFEENFLDEFYQIFQKYGLPEHSIEFELTESMFFDKEHIECIKKGIQRMHEMGFQCSMDDFGFGYSSLGLLKEFDVDTLKLDRSFFLDMSSGKARDIIQSVVELAIKLEVGTVAEGIEQTEQMDFLYSIQCDTVQGYFFSKPLPMQEFEDWVGQYEVKQSGQSV
ncbi:MAG: EAL domain-containing protein [bacterium]|nr:EAL domain-containing protein [bacterium]